MKTLRQIVKDHNLTIKEVADRSGGSYSTMVKASRLNNIDSISIRVIRWFADGLGTSAGELLDEVLGTLAERKIKFNDQHQLIQGVRIDDPTLYFDIKQAVLSNSVSGFIPTGEDIDMLLTQVENPNSNHLNAWREQWLQSTSLQVIANRINS